jgi:hypothetical protein
MSGGAVDRPLFLDINVGIGAKSTALDTGGTFALFGEDGSAAGRVEPGATGMFDVRVGYRMRPRLGFAAAVSAGQNESAGGTIASVPSPIRFASPTIVSLEAPGMKRREVGIHVQAVYFLPLGARTLVTFAGGPSFVHLQQGVPNVVVNGVSPVVVTSNESGSGVGGNVGLDLTQMLSDSFGVGLFARYAAASVNLPSASSVRAGGLQGGAGARIKF